MQNELDAGSKTIKTYDFIMKQDAEAARRAARNGTKGGGPGGRRSRRSADGANLRRAAKAAFS